MGKYKSIYLLHQWPRDLNIDYALSNHLFRAVKLTATTDAGKYKLSGYDIGFDSRS